MREKIGKHIVAGVIAFSMIAIQALPCLGYAKEEMVYTKANTEGKEYETIVSSYLRNDEKSIELRDESELENIKIAKQGQSYEQNGTELIWQTNGEDVYYQGTSTKQIPLKWEIHYELERKEITPQELAGKKGKIKIHLICHNQDAHTVEVNGKPTTLYTPFLVGATTVLDNNKMRNISITNGKVIRNGEKTLVLGLAFPGLQESLDWQEKDSSLPEEITITMETEEFELSNIICFATPKILEKEDVAKLDKFDTVFDQIRLLADSSKQLVQGGNQLQEGMNTYVEKAEEFDMAMNELQEGSSTIEQNYTKIGQGISGVKHGSEELSIGASSVNEGTKQLKGAICSVSDNLEKLLIGSHTTLEGEKKLNSGVNELILQSTNNLEELAKRLKNTITTDTESVTELTKNNVTLQKVMDSLSQEGEAELISTLKEQMQNNQTQITSLKKQIQEKASYLQQLQNKMTNSEAQMKELKQGFSSLEKGLTTICEGLTQLAGGTSKLQQASQELEQGTTSLYQGSKTLSYGTGELQKGSKQIEEGLSTLGTSTLQLAKANGQLLQGAEELSSGTKELKEGMDTFDKQGIQKLYDAIFGSGKETLERVKKLQQLADEFTGAEKNQINFITLFDEIQKEEEKEDQALPTQESKQNSSEEKEEIK